MLIRIKNQVSDKQQQQRIDKKATTKEDKNSEKARSQEVWENTKSKTTYQKPESKNNKLNNKNLKLSNTPFALLRMSEPSEHNSQENSGDDDDAENLEETPKATEKKEGPSDNKTKTKKDKKKKDQGSSLMEVAEEDRKDESEIQKVQENKKEGEIEVQAKETEKGIKDDKDAESSDEEEKSQQVDGSIKTGAKKKKKKKKKQTNELNNEIDEEKVDPRKVMKQIEDGKQKEGTSKSFARGGKDSSNKKQEPLSERLLFVPSLNYYNDLIHSMQVSPMQHSKELIKE